MAAVAVVLVGGSWLYWVGEGRPGTPAEFRQDVAHTGLVVAWSNAGPRGGSGLVDTSCGPTEVEIDDLDGDLWIRWNDRRAPLERAAIDDLITCD